MTSRERILKTINFQEPDRLPIDLGGSTGASSINVIAYNRLKKHLGFESKNVKCVDLMQQLADIESDIMERFHLDVFQVNPITFDKHWKNVNLYNDFNLLLPEETKLTINKNEAIAIDNSGKKYIKPAESYYFDALDGESWFSYQRPLSDEYLTQLQENVKTIYESTDYAISANFSGNFFSTLPEFMMEMALNPEKVDEELDKKCDDLIEKYKLINQAIGKYVFCVVWADDFGTQNAPMLSPDMFNERIVPPYKKFSKWLHKETDLKFFLHSCGAIEPLMDSIVDMGIDILNPIQTSANGMDPKLLKEKYGKKIVFWGGACDTQNVLGKKPIEEVIEHIKERIKVFAPGGGFVFNQVHVIQADIPAEHIIAMLDTAYEYGSYTNK